MPDLASPLMLRSPLTEARATLPAHLYGTRAALFYLLREAEVPADFAPPGPAPARPFAPPPSFVAPPAPRPSAQIVQMLPEPARPARAAVHDMLMSDSFDFRGFGDQG